MKIRTSLRKAISAAAVGLILASANASGTVLSPPDPVPQPSSDRAVGLTADAATGSPLSQSLAPLSGHVQINKITFWGFYLDANNDPLGANDSPFIDVFTITFDMTGSGLSGTLAKFIESGDILTRYEVSFSDIDYPSAPTTLDIINNFNDGSSADRIIDARWVWQGIGPTFNDARAYTIEGTQIQDVPEPGTLGLLGLALAGLGLARVRRLY